MVCGKFLAIAVALSAAFGLAARQSVGTVVGEMRVEVGADGVASFTMPFELLSGIGPSAYLDGDFVGDGWEGSDALALYDPSGVEIGVATWADGIWVDPVSGLPSSLVAEAGDIIVFSRFSPRAMASPANSSSFPTCPRLFRAPPASLTA